MKKMDVLDLCLMRPLSTDIARSLGMRAFFFANIVIAFHVLFVIIKTL